MDLDNRGIAFGGTPEDMKSRKKYISDFYTQWKTIIKPATIQH